ncbi:MAG: lipase, partial [Pseudomonadota bacterium]
FLRHAWRFWFYFMYPFSMLAIGVAVSLVLSMLIATSGVALAWLTAPIIFVAAMASFMKLIAKPYFVFHLMDLWSFSSDFIHRRRPDMDAILDELSSLVADNADGYDEIIMVGHSTGGALILDGAARALTSTPSIAAQKDRFWILTIGSTSLKIGLHPKAQWYRDKLNRALNGSNARWVEFQCHSDIINFARTNPAKLMGLTRIASPHFQAFNVRIKKMLHSKTYKRIKRNFFRVHYQFVFGNTRRYFYDFPAICFGPGGLGLRVENRRAFRRMLHPAFPDSESGEPPQENTQ